METPSTLGFSLVCVEQRHPHKRHGLNGLVLVGETEIRPETRVQNIPNFFWANPADVFKKICEHLACGFMVIPNGAQMFHRNHSIILSQHQILGVSLHVQTIGKQVCIRHRPNCRV